MLGFGLSVLILIAVEISVSAPFLLAFGASSAGAFLGISIATIVRGASITHVLLRIVRRTGGNARSLGLRLRQDDTPPPGSVTPDGRNRALSRLIGLTLATFFAAEAIIIAYSLLLQVVDSSLLDPEAQLPSDLFDHDWVLPFFGVALVLVTPFVEELLFRGFLFAGLLRRFGFIGSALFSGFLFSLAHIDPGFYIPFTLIGVLFAFAYMRTGSLFVPIGAHLLFNLASFLALVFVPEARG